LNSSNTYRYSFTALVLVLIITWLINISIGSISIPLKEVFKFLTGQHLENETWQTILMQLRFPKSLTLILVGIGLSISGLLMQTLFRNVMAGPSVLGISSGASLGVALLILGSGWLGWEKMEHVFGPISILMSAIIGATLVLLLILLLSLKLKNNLSILIIGLMLSALTAALISVLSVFSTAQKLQEYLFWGFGNVSNLGFDAILFLFVLITLLSIWIIKFLKPLNLLLLGENMAQSMGVRLAFTKNSLLIIVGIMVGVITVYVGPIAFVGLAVPHIARMLFKTSDHKVLFPAVILLGALMMLVCDSLAQVGINGQVIPINAVTSLLGAPIVIYLIFIQKNYQI
jgi:iron complex transport system permease protein